MFSLSPTLHIAENIQKQIQNMEAIHFNDMKEASNIFLKIRGIKSLYGAFACKGYGAFACKGARNRASCVGLVGLVRVGWAGWVGSGWLGWLDWSGWSGWSG